VTDFLKRPMRPLPKLSERWFRRLHWMRALLAPAAPALLFVPMLQTTIGTLHAPAPWGVAEAQRWAVLVTWVLGWVVLPLAVGIWRRRWSWPLLCLGTVLATAWAWNGGQALIGPYDNPYLSWHTAPPVAAEVMPQALVLGGLAAVMAGVGIVLADPVRRLDPRVVRLGIAMGLILAIVPVVVACVVNTLGPGLGNTEFLRLVSMVTLLAATTYGPLKAGQWIGQWWWVPACLLGPMALIWFWGLPYLNSLPARSPTSYLDIIYILVGGGFSTLVAGIAAGVGVSKVPLQDPTGDR
jgi:hypothetical protein